MNRGPRIELWVEERGGEPAVNPVMRKLLSVLAAGGAEVFVRVPEREAGDRAERPDLILLKSATDLALSRAVAAEASGTRFLNGARATRRAHDKAAAVAALAAAGLPVPATFLFSEDGGGIPLPEGDLVSKPVRGVHGRGVAFHDGRGVTRPREEEAGASFVADDGTRLLQRRIGGDEPDLKVYVADGRPFAGRKHFSAGSYATDQIQPVQLDRMTEDIVLGTGDALGLLLFGVDLRFDDGEAFVIDANPFPGFRGFPEAVGALKAEVGRALCR